MRLGVGIALALSLVGTVGAAGAASDTHGLQSKTQAAQFVPGEVLVRFKPGVDRTGRAAALQETSTTRKQWLRLPGAELLELPRGTSVEAAVRELESVPEVLYAEPNFIYHAALTPNDPRYGELWGLNQASDADIDGPEAWDLTTGSSAVTVAIVDTGVAYDHPDLAPNMLPGYDFVDNDGDPRDENGHGTHVAGTIGAAGNNGIGVTGVNWDVGLMPVRVLDADGGGTNAEVTNGFAYAAANGARVVNASLGGGGYSQAMKDTIDLHPNTLYVVAAGNGGADEVGDNNDITPTYPCNYTSVNVVCVAATMQADALATFSNYGAASVDLAAPGTDILSAIPEGYDTFDGTSMATPHVAGVAALILSLKPAASSAAVRQALLSGVDVRPGLAGLVATGGRLNAWRPLPPVGLTAGSSTAQNLWTNNATVSSFWSGATDPAGIDGYSFSWSPDRTSVPDEIKDVEEKVTSKTAVVPDGSQWFHVRAADGLGNWGAPVHVGPFLIDTFPPARPTLSSSSHRAGRASADRTVDVNWITLGDSLSGLDGFSFAWSRRRLVPVDPTKDLEESAVRRTSPRLAPGRWWFGIKARDNAGNLSGPVTLGPFVITARPPVCTVPRLRGLTLIGAKRALIKKGCALGRISRTYSRRVRRGRIVAQRPRPGLRLRRGAKIAVALSRGRRRR
jgi:subtilisin family serine protease